MTTGVLAHLDEDRCAELVLGLLGHTERDQAIAHAEHCETCALRLREHVAAQVRMYADRPHARVVKAAFRRIPRMAYWLPAAAALVMVSVLLVRGLGLRENVAESRWLPSPGEPQLLRGEALPDSHFAAGMAAYGARDLRGATRELALARAEGPAEHARRLYLAHAWLELGEPERALPLLRSLDHVQLPSAVSREAVGMLARALRATGHSPEADTLDRMLRRTPEWVPVRP